ncbi:MAG: cytochrome c-type biogenesis protein CcmH [Bdellovibrio sp.]|nr:cytochrome c-type biogenesis protein CcmH [Methylotenera sp.]
MKKLFVVLLLLANAAFAGVAKPLADDPVIEARLKAMSRELRCLVCQNSTLADSTAPLAEDLRKEIRVLMHEGKTDQEVVAYLVARYGDFVRYRPPVNNETAVLWFGPFALLLIGAFVLYRVLKKHAGNDELKGEDA